MGEGGAGEKVCCKVEVGKWQGGSEGTRGGQGREEVARKDEDEEFIYG